MMRTALMSLILGLGMAVSAMAEKPKSAGDPEVSVSRTLDQALELAGENAAELEAAMGKMDSAAEREALTFLIRFMPKRDLVALDGEFLAGQVDLAFQARKANRWAAEVPVDIFYNDVLPYAVLNEKREDWRSDFRHRFAPMVKNAKTLREAVVIINKAIKDEVGVEYSTEREKADQSPSESMNSGLASCTGLSILLCDALRSVGIPARIVGTPLWRTKRGNHNWVEFYDPVTGEWHFTEYYPDSKGIDHGWFVADASKAKAGDFLHAIYASSWKPTGKCFPLVWDMDINYVPGVDVTKRYIERGKPEVKLARDACELRIEYRDGGSVRRAVSVKVYRDENLIGEGMTPGRLADANEFLTITAKQKDKLTVVVQTEEGEKLTKRVETTIGDRFKLVSVAGS